MILKLYDSNGLKLHYFDLFQERLEYLNEHFFSTERYKRFYCKYTSNNKDREYVKYWFGVKPVGHMQKVENVKNTLDYVSGYLLNSRDFDTNKTKKRYLELLEKREKLIISHDESIQLNKLSQQVLYKKPTKSFKMNKNLIFMINNTYENFIKGKSKEIERSLYQIKSDAIHKVDLLNDLTQRKKILTDEISELYNASKTDKTNREISIRIISDNTYKIKYINNELQYIRRTIEELYSDYYYTTENKILK